MTQQISAGNRTSICLPDGNLFSYWIRPSQDGGVIRCSLWSRCETSIFDFLVKEVERVVGNGDDVCQCDRRQRFCGCEIANIRTPQNGRAHDRVFEEVGKKIVNSAAFAEKCGLF